MTYLLLLVLKYWTMDKVQKNSNTECYAVLLIDMDSLSFKIFCAITVISGSLSKRGNSEHNERQSPPDL
jgi:hypothetical protein